MKIEEQVLSIEQMKHLQELGIDTSDASMCWVAGEDTSTDEEECNLIIHNNFILPHNIPTYTIGDIIKKLPKIIGNHRLLVDFDAGIAYYEDWFSDEVLNCIGGHSSTDRPITNALYDCLCWVAEKHKELLEVKK